MKKRIILFTSVLLFGGVILMSEDNGPALNNNARTGARGSLTHCGGGGCHGGNSANTIATIEVDSAGTPVTGYVPGGVYNITIGGGNAVSGFTTFGIQFAAVSGTGVGQVQAGTFSALPAGLTTHTLGGIQYVEHSTPITGPYPTCSKSFTWTAPASTTLSTITMYCTVNSVNGDDHAGSTDLSGNVSIPLAQRVPVLSAATVTAAVDIKTYPNPVGNSLQIQLDNTTNGTYTINAYDLGGRKVATQDVAVTGSSTTAAMNTYAWASGVYQVQVVKDGAQKVVSVVKQ